jgi:hypothetical protein
VELLAYVGALVALFGLITVVYTAGASLGVTGLVTAGVGISALVAASSTSASATSTHRPSLASFCSSSGQAA